MAVINVFAGNILNLNSEASSNFKILSVSNDILFVDSFQEVPYSQRLSSLVPFGHTVHTTYGSYVASVASFLNLGQSTHPKVKVESVSNYLALTHAVLRSPFEEIVSVLDLQQVLTAALAKNAPNNLNITQTVTKSLIKGPSVTHSLNLSSLVAYYLNDRNFYVANIPTLPGVLSTPCGVDRNQVMFSQGSIIIKLPRPELGNQERFDFTRINRRSRGGDLIVYRDNQWPRTKTLTLTFAWLSEAQKQSILSFIQSTVGQEVSYADHYGNTWNGFIMTPTNKVVQESLNNKTLSLEFQGVKQ